MDYSVNDVQAWLQEIKFNIPADEIQEKVNGKIRELRKEISIPGFRKGKVPVDIIRMRFGKMVLEDILEDAINDTFKEIVTKDNLQIIGPPEIQDQKWDENNGLDVRLEVQVEPDIELNNYKGLQVTKEIHKIADDEIETTIERLRKENAVVEDIDGEAQLGDFVKADFQEVDAGGVPILGHKDDDVEIELGSSAYGQDFDNQLVGIKKGEERKVEQKAKDGASKYYSVRVKDITRHKLPELNDEFAKDLGDYESLEDLRQKVREYLEHDFEKQSRKNLVEGLIDALIAENPFEVPPLMIENALEGYIEDIKKQIKTDFDVESFSESQRPYVIRSIKWYLIKKKLVDLEDLKVSDGDVDAYLEKLAEETGQSIKKLKAKYSLKNRREKLKDSLQEEKIVDFLLKNSEIEEVEFNPDQPKIIAE